MGQRQKLNSILESIVPNVYFQPPETVKLKYDCIIYKLEHIDKRPADNASYTLDDRYQLTYITRDPDSDIRHVIAELPKCRFTRSFTADNLNHYIYQIYY